MHSREVITSSMVLYSILKMIHGGVIHHKQDDVNLLMLNKYYVIPIINVDGLSQIESKFMRIGKIMRKRKNGRKQDQVKCKGQRQ